MLYIDSIWEYIVNFLELALFIIFNKKTCTEKNQVMLAGLLRVSGNLSAYNGKYAEKFWNNNSDD